MMMILEPGVYLGCIALSGYDGETEINGECFGYKYTATKGDMLIAMYHESSAGRPDIRIRNIYKWTEHEIMFEKFKL